MRIATVCCLAAVTVGASAHEFTVTRTVVVLKADHTFLIDLTIDVDALALGVSSATPESEIVPVIRALPPAEQEKLRQRAVETLRKRVRVYFDDEKHPCDITFPPVMNPDPEIPTVFGTTARLAGTIPADATAFSMRASRALSDLELTIFEETTGNSVKYLVGTGGRSPPFTLGATPTEDHSAVFGRYLWLGITHIVPKGLDHILFVLGLFLLSARLRPLLWQISAFTLAHTLTLALSMTGVVSVSPSIVEPLIAASIVYVAIENIFARELHWWRPVVVFAFGLLHGLGFAGVLQELGLPPQRFPAALAGFNVGVEIGQLAVVFAALLLVGWFRDKKWYRNVITIPGSIAIALIAMFWVLERTGLIGVQ